MKRIGITLLIFLFAINMASAQKMSKKERKAQKKLEVKELVESGNYAFEANSASPLRGRTINLTSDYDLQVKGDSIKAYLPYFGRAYSVSSYGSSEGGIKFNERAENFKIDYNEKKEVYELSADVNTDDERYEISLDIGSAGYASLRINCTNRDAISFYGELAPIEIE